jgi:hypothetical protein
MTSLSVTFHAQPQRDEQEWSRAWGPALTALFFSERDFIAGEDAPWIDDIRNQLTLLRMRALVCCAAAGLGIGSLGGLPGLSCRMARTDGMIRHQGEVRERPNRTHC